jgi:hypothetical protein
MMAFLSGRLGHLDRSARQIAATGHALVCASATGVCTPPGLSGTRDLLNYLCLALMAARFDQLPGVKELLARVKAAG